MTFDERLRHLLRLFADNKATEGDIREMLTLLRGKDDDTELESFILRLRQDGDSSITQLPVEWEDIWDKIHQSAVRPATPVRKINWLRIAAAIIILISAGAYFFNRNTSGGITKNDIVKAVPVQELRNDVLPGGNKAILTLANGSQIILDSAANGLLAQQGNTEVVKLANGQLVYKEAGGKAAEVLYNTMGTPRGGQYRLILPDGSKVWLNAVSSIRYPTAFIGKERTVEITGEAYFEIAKDKSRPFKVLVGSTSTNGGMEVAVLGTHFNINAYSDEPVIKTTLLEGSVKVTRDTRSTVIRPGEQTQLNSTGALKVIRDADVEEALAWKDGLFEFNDADLQGILRQLMRWYDVDVEYQGVIPHRYFTAVISRDKTLTGVLEILKLSGVEYKLEGKKLIVTP
jgi:transmembrane sensor